MLSLAVIKAEEGSDECLESDASTGCDMAGGKGHGLCSALFALFEFSFCGTRAMVNVNQPLNRFCLVVLSLCRRGAVTVGRALPTQLEVLERGSIDSSKGRTL